MMRPTAKWLSNPSRLEGTSTKCDHRNKTLTGVCQCARPAPLPVPEVSDTDERTWGLPSAGCPGNWTRYWTHVYPRLHREWRAKGRVVVHCTHHTGLGNYLRSVPGALVYSAITEQALTLYCDDRSIMKKEGGRLVGMAPTLAQFLKSPHFDWDFTFKLPADAPTVDLYAAMSQPHLFAWNATRGSRVHSTHSVFPRRIFQFTKRSNSHASRRILSCLASLPDSLTT